MKNRSHRDHSAAKAFTAFMVLVLAFVMLLIFQSNQDSLLIGNGFQVYMILATLGAGLLLGLLYLVNKPHQTKSSKKKKK